MSGRARATRGGPSPELAAADRRVLRSLRRPEGVQEFLDGLRYSTDAFYRCPARVLRERVAHCADGAVLAAAALLELGERPELVFLDAVRDDGHVLVVFRRGGRLGALAKSNFAGLRWREPVYRSLRELAMSYFEDYFNLEGERTLRAYSAPLPLAKAARLARLPWRTSDEGTSALLDVALDARPMRPLLPPSAARKLSRVDPRSMRAGMVGTSKRGAYRVRDS